MNTYVSTAMNGDHVWIHMHTPGAELQVSRQFTRQEAIRLGKELISTSMGLEKLLEVPDE